MLLFFLSLIVFVMARLCPGDPLRAWYGASVDRMNEAGKEAARTSLGLNEPIWIQYMEWIKNLLHGDLGISFKYKRPVLEVIESAWLNTLTFGLLSYVVTFVLSFALGKFCASREGSRVDRMICRAGVISGNVPTFFLSLLFILFFAVKLKILPTGGAYSYGMKYNVVNRLWHMVLPVSVMVIGHLWYYAYMIRNLLVEETRKDYVLLLKAQGIPRKLILGKYCVKNILPPMLIIMALAVPHLVGGTYVVEMVFGYPGLGSLSFESALYKDYNMLMALTMITGVVIITANYFAQVMGEKMDHRMKEDEFVEEEEEDGEKEKTISVYRNPGYHTPK